MKGIFLTIEGVDGAGKTTQVKLLQEWFRKEGYDPLFTREPGGTRVGDAIRNLLLSREYTGLVPVAEALLYAASRAQLVAEVIRPAWTRAAWWSATALWIQHCLPGLRPGLPRAFVERSAGRPPGAPAPADHPLDLEPNLREERLDGEEAGPGPVGGRDRGLLHPGAGRLSGWPGKTGTGSR